MTDVSTAIGHSQFKDMDKLIRSRNFNRQKIVSSLKKNDIINKNFYFVEPSKNVKPSWFGIAILIKDKLKRKKFIKKLEKNGIESRPIISGNFIKQPSVKKYNLVKNKILKIQISLTTMVFLLVYLPKLIIVLLIE